MFNKFLTDTKNNLNIYLQKEVLKVWIFGFASGLALMLSGNTLNFWLAKLGINKVTVGLFSLVALPYSCKYAIAPIVDRIKIPIFHNMGRRKSWILVSQVFLIIFLILLSFTDPQHKLFYTAFFALCVASAAVIQDIALDAYRIETLKENQKGPGSAMYIFGYRIGMLVSGGGAIYLSSISNWKMVYIIMAICVAITMTIISVTKENKSQYDNTFVKTKFSLYNIFLKPFENISNFSNLFLILLFILIYRLPDNIIAVMANHFLLDLGFNEKEIATAVKFFGVGAALVGGCLSGLIIPKISIQKSLFLFGIIHLLANMLLVVQAWVGYNISLLYFIIGAENITGGMAMTAYIAYITGLCKGQYAATQYALFSSFIGLSRVLLPSISGVLASINSWPAFFFITSLLGIPSLILIRSLNKNY
ncbi:MAG: AmpG family muropeptide MFS transporter [Alphaproteobacteria bacterium]